MCVRATDLDEERRRKGREHKVTVRREAQIARLGELLEQSRVVLNGGFETLDHT